jgi:hypothetical protein
VKITATFLLALGLTSCFAPKASIVAEAPVNNKPRPAQNAVAEISPEKIKPTLPVVRNTGLRLPADMLDLPQDEQIRSAPDAPKEGKATVIARPPEE